MDNLLLQNFKRQHIQLTPEEIEVIHSAFVPKAFRKHKYILQQGDIARYETFIVKGLTRTYEVDEKGHEHVLQFGLEDWWVGDLYSFLTNIPTFYNIDCLEDTEVLQISKPHLDQLYEQVPQMNQYFRILLQNAFITTTKRIGSSLSKSAMERYQEFIRLINTCQLSMT